MAEYYDETKASLQPNSIHHAEKVWVRWLPMLNNYDLENKQKSDDISPFFME